MRCSEAAVQLQLYIDQQLTIQQVRALEAHLERCPGCQHQLYQLEEVVVSLRDLQTVSEPANMTMLIMQRVALSSQRNQELQFSLLRPSLLELLTVFFLASITTLGIIWQQPSLRSVLPFAATLSTILHSLINENMGSLSLVLWVGGTILGVCITLVLVGNEIRTQWFKAMIDRLPVR